jgi:hypothetical protein
MEATFVLSSKGRGKKTAWSTTEVLGKVFCYTVAVRLGELSNSTLLNRSNADFVFKKNGSSRRKKKKKKGVGEGGNTSVMKTTADMYVCKC